MTEQEIRDKIESIQRLRDEGKKVREELIEEKGRIIEQIEQSRAEDVKLMKEQSELLTELNKLRE